MDPSYFDTTTWKIYRVLSPISAAISGFHGYKRHQNGDHPILWGVAWFALGGLFPVITPVIGAAQGFTKALPAGDA